MQAKHICNNWAMVSYRFSTQMTRLPNVKFHHNSTANIFLRCWTDALFASGCTTDIPFCIILALSSCCWKFQNLRLSTQFAYGPNKSSFSWIYWFNGQCFYRTTNKPESRGAGEMHKHVLIKTGSKTFAEKNILVLQNKYQPENKWRNFRIAKKSKWFGKCNWDCSMRPLQ